MLWKKQEKGLRPRVQKIERKVSNTTGSGAKPGTKRARQEDAGTKTVAVTDPKVTIQFNTGNAGDYVLRGFPSLEVSASFINNEDDVLRIVENERRSALEEYNLTSTVMDVMEVRFVRTGDDGIRLVESFDSAEFRKWRDGSRKTGKHLVVLCSCVACSRGKSLDSEAHESCVVVVFDMLDMVNKLEVLMEKRLALDEEEGTRLREVDMGARGASEETAVGEDAIDEKEARRYLGGFQRGTQPRTLATRAGEPPIPTLVCS